MTSLSHFKIRDKNFFREQLSWLHQWKHNSLHTEKGQVSPVDIKLLTPIQAPKTLSRRANIQGTLRVSNSYWKGMGDGH